MRSTRLVRFTTRAGVAAAAIAAVLTLPAGAGAANPVGFQFDLAGGDHVECNLTAGVLSCLNYSAQATGSCDFGGAVAGKVLRRTGAPTAKTFCVDEAFHGYPTLKPGKTWTRGALSCRIRRDSTALTCRNRTARATIWADAAA